MNLDGNDLGIGKIDISQEELKDILGDGDITYTITK